MTDESDDQSKQSKGGHARRDALSEADRRRIAREAAEARWGTDLPKATHEGVLPIAGATIQCAVLNSGKRVLTQETFLTAVGRAAKAKGGKGSSGMAVTAGDDLPPFLAAKNLIPFVDEELRRSTTPVVYRTKTGGKAFGYDAFLLPAVCEVYLKAKDAGKLLDSQVHIADRCSLLTRGLARVGILALVDDATGFTSERAREELAQIFNAYIAEELRPWTKRFPDDFFRLVYKLYGWAYQPGSTRRTPEVGKFINRYVYEPMPVGVLEAMQVRNPVVKKWQRRHKNFQFLSADTGDDHLDRQLLSTMTIMRVAKDKEEFEQLWARAYPGQKLLDFNGGPSTSAESPD